MNLPNSFTKVIEKYGIDRKDIVFAAMADLDEEFRFADSIVAITDKKLMRRICSFADFYCLVGFLCACRAQ